MDDNRRTWSFLLALTIALFVYHQFTGATDWAGFGISVAFAFVAALTISEFFGWLIIGCIGVCIWGLSKGSIPGAFTQLWEKMMSFIS